MNPTMDRSDFLLFAVPILLVLGFVLLLSGSPEEKQSAPPIIEVAPKPQPTEVPPAEYRPGSDFDPMPTPGPNDWLAMHHEYGQGFESFTRSMPNRPDDNRRTIYLLPLNDFLPAIAPSVAVLERFAAAYFGLDVQVLSAVTLGEDEVHSRVDEYSGATQFLTTDILALLKKRLPDDAYCLLGVTMDDIYPGPSWNYVFGEALLRERVAVYSFCRYDPAFYGEPVSDAGALMLRRSLKVLAHETAHMFGLRHCTAYSCVMNGANHLEEADSTPFHLCPVDLRKLQWSVGFDVEERYRRLARFYRGIAMDDEARWIEQRVKSID